jgi:hypothetical protein
MLLSGTCAATTASQEPEAINTPTHPISLAVFTSGVTVYKRQGWTNFAPIAFGTTLRLGDLLKVGEASNLKVVCSDLTLHDVSAGVSGFPCPQSAGVLIGSDGSLINITRSADAFYPTILSPRKTKLLSALPLLSWTPVDGAQTYNIMVRGFSYVWTMRVNSTTRIPYPTNAPPLKPDNDYKLIVQAGGRSSEEEPGNKMGFSIVGEVERKAVEREQLQIEALKLPSGPALFVTAYLYRSHGLEAEAIEKLEAALKSFKEPAVARLLGDCYLEIGLIRKAEQAYLNSLAMTTSGSDEEDEAMAHLMLGDVVYRRALGNKKEAAVHLNAALAAARTVGDAAVADQALKALAELQLTSQATRSGSSDAREQP